MTVENPFRVRLAEDVCDLVTLTRILLEHHSSDQTGAVTVCECEVCEKANRALMVAQNIAYGTLVVMGHDERCSLGRDHAA